MGKKSKNKAKKDKREGARASNATAPPVPGGDPDPRSQGSFVPRRVPHPLVPGQFVIVGYKSPYAVPRWDYGSLPRWPNDGIEQEQKKRANDSTPKIQHNVPDDFSVEFSRMMHPQKHRRNPRPNDPKRLTLKELLGFFPSKIPLGFEDVKSKHMNFPYMLQEKAAREQSDEASTKNHLIAGYISRGPEVLGLLDQINCRKAIYKASTDPSRFPDLRTILVPLFQKDLASDANVELLFGKLAHVRHLLFEIGALVAEPGSPQARYYSGFKYKEDTKPIGAKVCAGCESVSDGTVEYKKCSACKKIHYCSQQCQLCHWPIHRPNCMKARGKEVPQKFLDKAEQAMTQKMEQLEVADRRQKFDRFMEFQGVMNNFRSETPEKWDTWAYTPAFLKLRVYVPTTHCIQVIRTLAEFASLEFVQDLSFSVHPYGIYPDGIDPSMRVGVNGLELKHDSSGARVLVLFAILYPKKGESAGVGLYIDGMFVVENVIEGRAQWKQVREPSYSYDENRFKRLLKYLQAGSDAAKVVPEGVDLGIKSQDQGDSSVTLGPYGWVFA